MTEREQERERECVCVCVCVASNCLHSNRQSLKEVISDPTVAEKLADTKAANEIRVLNSFYEMLKSQPDRAFYGYNHCLLAANNLAIQDLLVTDELFRYLHTTVQSLLQSSSVN
jgi:stalled ribosome rescue protein Dom34